MSAFIDCMVCRKRVTLPDSNSMSDEEVVANLITRGCTVNPTRCPEHAGTDGLQVVLAGYKSLASCTLDHDPEPWLIRKGIAMAQVTFSAGGAQSGRATLGPRPEYCQEQAHYWIYDKFTIPEDLLEAPAEEPAPEKETCRLCQGSGRIASGVWGVRPPKVTCPECQGEKVLPTDHQYQDETI